MNFKLRFDDQLTTIDGAPLITQEEEADAAPDVTKPKSQNPDIAQSAGDGSDGSWIMQRVPKECSFEKAGYRQAHKFDMVLDYKELPIDPRTVEAALVEIHLGTISDDLFAKGFQGDGRDFDKRLKSVLRTRNPDDSVNETTLRLVGLVDDWEVEHGPNGSEVAISGRDLRGVLLDTPINAGATPIGRQLLDTIDWGKPINEVVLQILGHNTWFNKIRCVSNSEDWPKGIVPSPGLGKGGVLNIRRQKGAKGDNEAAKPKPPAGAVSLSFWDVIVRSCFLVGGIPYFVGNAIHIRPAATIYDKLRRPLDPIKNPTPFKGGRIRYKDARTGKELDDILRHRRLVYGRDVESLRITRKFAGWRKPKVVRVISIDLDAPIASGRLVVGRYPPESAAKANATAKSPGANKPKEEVVTARAPAGIVDPDRLVVIAKSLYEEIGRGELGGEVITNNLSSFGGDNSDPDLLRLEVGDGIEFLVDTQAIRSGIAPVVSTFTDSRRLSFEAQVKVVARTIGNVDLARVIVATARGQINELQRFFRVQNVKFHWDTSGVKISFDFQNYVVARAQAEKASAAPGTAVTLSADEGKISPLTPRPPGSLGGGRKKQQ